MDNLIMLAMSVRDSWAEGGAAAACPDTFLHSFTAAEVTLAFSAAFSASRVNGTDTSPDAGGDAADVVDVAAGADADVDGWAEPRNASGRKLPSPGATAHATFVTNMALPYTELFKTQQQ